jgi:hypothetical protein
VSDEIMSARTKSVHAGGGTCMANGIRYIAKKNYVKRGTDKLFVISDFQDSLDDWCNAVEKIPGIHYAIGYNVSTEEECNEMLDRNNNYRSSGTFAERWNKFWHTIFITETIRN